MSCLDGEWDTKADLFLFLSSLALLATLTTLRPDSIASDATQLDHRTWQLQRLIFLDKTEPGSMDMGWRGGRGFGCSCVVLLWRG